MNYRNALNEGKNRLKDANVLDSDLDAWYLMQYVTGLTKQQYYMVMSDEMPQDQYDRYTDVVLVRANRIPLQHITNEQDFMGLKFYVNEHVLIPRQDTEVLVEQALKYIPQGGDILDMCTGSGCILLSLMHYSKAANGVGADISNEALEVARVNANSICPNVSLVESDLFNNIDGCYDVIVSNPPYIATAVIDTLQDEVKYHDPYIALDGSADGLIFYKRIIDKAPDYIKNGGYLLFEIGYDQGEAVSSLMIEKSFDEVEIIKDLSGLNRVVKGRYYV